MWAFLWGYWYLIPIVAALAYVGGHTRDHWAPATCITLLLLVPSFIPPRGEGIDAITITQLVDVVIIGVLISREGRQKLLGGAVEGPLPVGIYPVLAGVLVGAVLLAFLGCRVGLLLYVPTASWIAVTMFLPALTIHRRVRRLTGHPPARWAQLLGGVLLGTTAFGLPALRLLRSGESPAQNRYSVTSLKALGMVTGSAFVVNSVVAYHLLGMAAFDWSALWPVLVGALAGTLIRFWHRSGAPTAVWDAGYGVALSLFAGTSIYYLVFRVGLR